ncbi:glycerol-3-phosphate 1-O-acyltransferase PlsY [soil metagenome]
MTGLAVALGIPLLLALQGYVIGSISSGFLVGKLYRGVDLRRIGSGSTGATNTLRTLGPGAALLVAVLDILKGALAVWIARLLVHGGGDATAIAEASAAVGAVAGHGWPVFLKGRGGRGVATGFGALLFIARPAWLVSVAGFALAVGLTRMVSVGSLAAAAGAIGGYLFFAATGVISFQPPAFAFILVAAAIITLRHRANIIRIARGVEPRL